MLWITLVVVIAAAMIIRALVRAGAPGGQNLGYVSEKWIAEQRASSLDSRR